MKEVYSEEKRNMLFMLQKLLIFFNNNCASGWMSVQFSKQSYLCLYIYLQTGIIYTWLVYFTCVCL